MKPKFFLLALCGALVLTALPLQAQTYNEIGDAGQTIGTAQSSGLTITNATASIFGTIESPTDADIFSIQINTPMLFTATTVGGSILDTSLFLFNNLGNAIYTNDDANGSSFQSTLPAGSSFTMTLAPGLYYIAISLSGNEPINSNGQLLFAPYIGGNSTSVRGPAAGINPTTLANFNGLNSFDETGAYRIDFTIAPVPEPSTVALVVIGVGAAGVALRKRRRRESASV